MPVVIAWWAGYRQGQAAERTLELAIVKATPRVGSRVSIRRFNPPTRPDVIRFAIENALYNDGDASAIRVQGEWKITADHQITNQTIPINLDSLPSFLPHKTEIELSGNTNVLYQTPTVTLEVHIDLQYVGLDGKSKPYKATYRYDYASRTMQKISI